MKQRGEKTSVLHPFLAKMYSIHQNKQKEGGKAHFQCKSIQNMTMASISDT